MSLSPSATIARYSLDDHIKEIVGKALSEQLQGLTVKKRLYTVAEAAEYLGRTEKAVRTLVRDGYLSVTSHDGAIRIDSKDLDEYCVKYKHQHEAAA